MRSWCGAAFRKFNLLALEREWLFLSHDNKRVEVPSLDKIFERACPGEEELS
jgi:hypothetical protein